MQLWQDMFAEKRARAVPRRGLKRAAHIGTLLLITCSKRGVLHLRILVIPTRAEPRGFFHPARRTKTPMLLLNAVAMPNRARDRADASARIAVRARIFWCQSIATKFDEG